MRHVTMTIVLGLISLLCAACQGSAGGERTTADTDTAAVTIVPTFDADSALLLVQAQCDMGPRVPGTPAHRRCAAWLSQRLRAVTDTVIEQRGEVVTFDGKHLTAVNIIGSINPGAAQRVLLLAHWDCRPWADNDPDEARRREPVMGANDAASGVAVLLEMARAMAKTPPAVGVDILLVDVEDWGTDGDEDSWALGTQYWVQHPHVPGYQPVCGILLDMVGAKGAQFAQEYYSLHYASGIVDLVWQEAAKAGFATRFVGASGHAITDDHVVVNRAGIPCIDIIDTRTHSKTGFFDAWHTTHDTMEHIDLATLRAVGQTLLNVLYSF
ncbi:MAG: M28 family peptidase [Muribaculaceae bacterium]|nr:M28 family peptidase [Muribaculaceae bacterium]